jgi:hypothetical protein
LGGGDFNVTLHLDERLGGLPKGLRFLILWILWQNRVLWTFHWVEGSPLGPIVRRGPGWIVFLVFPEWDFSYPGLMQKKLLRVCSDHAPIFLNRGCLQTGKRSFKFENIWLKDEGFVEKVKIWWDSFHFFGSPSFVLAKKLRALKWEIKKWNLEEFGDVGRGIKPIVRS